MRFSTLSSLLALGLLAACEEDPTTSNPTNPSATAENPCAGQVQWYRDLDNDGYGDPSVPSDECEAPLGYVDNALDCDDDNRNVNPASIEVCDVENNDENCDGLADNDDPNAEGKFEAWPDLDMDGFGVDGPTTWYCDLPPDAAQNTLDCDDTLPGAWPGAAFNESVIDCMNDADGDGWGDANASGAVVPGTDCDDSDSLSFPGGEEVWTDGVDQNCDGVDQYAYIEDWEGGVIDPMRWDGFFGAQTVSAPAVDGFAVALGGSHNLRSVSADASLCTVLDYTFKVKRGDTAAPPVGDRLIAQFKSNVGNFVTFERVEGTGAIDPAFQTISGQITDPTAIWDDLEIRFESVGGSQFFVDDIEVGCPGEDLDGDGFPGAADCDDGDPNHWDDCGNCIDNDGDDYGVGCNLGGDCDDTDASANPAGADSPGDGVDANCDGFDGVVLLETFESGTISVPNWSAVTGDVTVGSTDTIGGAFSAEFSVSGEAQTRAMDLSSCPEMTWYFRGRRGPVAPDAGDMLSVDYWDGAAWVNVDTWLGAQFDDSLVTERAGRITDPAALAPGAMWRLVSDSPSGGSFFVDDIVVGCPDDLDGDLRPAVVDCDDDDPDHWADCGLCVDEDMDGYGLGCDLGFDCDDLDPAVNPAQVEIPQDGIDQDCDLIDDIGLMDDFELGMPDPAIWATQAGDVEVVEGFAADGRHSVALRGDGALLETIPTDASLCRAGVWSWSVRRGPTAPSASATLSFEVWDGAAWVTMDTVSGTGLDDTAWDLQFDANTSANLRTPDARARLSVVGGTPGADVFYVDDFAYLCGDTDQDGDGFPPPLDCDDTSAANWDDCWTCIDTDGDGFGVDCNIADVDCNPSDPTVYPGAPDSVGDGIDQNCDGVDGTVLFDDFEYGDYDPAIWESWSGDTYVGTDYSFSGSYSLNMGGDIGEVISQPMLASACGEFEVSMMIKRGPETPDGGDFVWLDYWTGTNWTQILEYEGLGITETDFSLVSFTFGGGVGHNDLKFRFSSDGSGANFDDFFIDDFSVRCLGTDSDQDGVLDSDDCAPNDAAHWADCGLCTDGDGDGYGVGCDLGEDCDDTDAAFNPGAPDLLNDGIDWNCDGSDAGFLDDFETGVLSADWLTFGNAGWVVVNGGAGGSAYSARNGNINDNQTSTLLITLDFPTGGDLSFSHMGDTESGWDFMFFYIDGVQMISRSGNWGWTAELFTLTPGQHTFEWTYDKDASVSVGADSFWIDDVFAPAGSPVP